MARSAHIEKFLLIHVGGAADGRVELAESVGGLGRRTIGRTEYLLRPVSAKNGRKILFFVPATYAPDEADNIDNQIDFWMGYLEFVDVAFLARQIGESEEIFELKHIYRVNEVGRRFLEPSSPSGPQTREIPNTVINRLLVRFALQINSMISKSKPAPNLLVYFEVFESKGYTAHFEFKQNWNDLRYVLKSLSVENVTEILGRN